MQNSQKQVKEFHEKFNLVINDKPIIPDEATLKLRCKLLLEEVLEFVTACGFELHIYGQKEISINDYSFIPGTTEPYLVEMADALADIQYVNDGAAISLGIDLEPIATEVHRSNMSKLWTTEEINKLREDKSLSKWSAKGNVVDGFCVKDKDGKIIKSPSYSPADIKKELELQSKINNKSKISTTS